MKNAEEIEKLVNEFAKAHELIEGTERRAGYYPWRGHLFGDVLEMILPQYKFDLIGDTWRIVLEL